MRTIGTILALGLLTVMAAQANAADGKACLQKGSIRGWTVPDNQHLVVNSNVSEKYNVTLQGRCIGVQFAEGLAFETRGGSLCVEPGDSINFNQSGLAQHCVITGIDALKAEETPR